MCVPIETEKAALAWYDEQMRVADTLFDRYPRTPNTERYKESVLRELRNEVGYWQRYHRWLMDIDAETLQPKAPVVDTKPGVRSIKALITDRALAKVKADIEVEVSPKVEAKVHSALDQLTKAYGWKVR